MDRLTILRLHVFCKSATSHIMFFFRTLSPHVRMQAHTRIVYSHTRACASSQIWMHTSARTRARIGRARARVRVRVRAHAVGLALLGANILDFTAQDESCPSARPRTPSPHTRAHALLLVPACPLPLPPNPRMRSHGTLNHVRCTAHGSASIAATHS